MWVVRVDVWLPVSGLMVLTILYWECVISRLSLESGVIGLQVESSFLCGVIGLPVVSNCCVVSSGSHVESSWCVMSSVPS